MYPDKLGNTPLHYVAAKYDTKIFADFMLHLPLPKRQIITDLPNSQRVDCRTILHQKTFFEPFYIKKVLADDKHSSLATKFAHRGFLRQDCKQQLTQPENLDSAYTISHSLFLSTVRQQHSGQDDKVS